MISLTTTLWYHLVMHSSAALLAEATAVQNVTARIAAELCITKCNNCVVITLGDGIAQVCISAAARTLLPSSGSAGILGSVLHMGNKSCKDGTLAACMASGCAMSSCS